MRRLSADCNRNLRLQTPYWVPPPTYTHGSHAHYICHRSKLARTAKTRFSQNLSNIRNIHLPQLVTKKETIQFSRLSYALQAGRFRDRIPMRDKYFLFSIAFQTGSGAHPTSCILDTGAISLWQSGWGVASYKQLQLTPMLRKVGDSLLQPICAHRASYREKSTLLVT